MKKITVFWSVLLILLTISFLNAQNVQVTFRVNTSTVPDTVTPNSAVVQVRGGTAPLTWGNDTGGQMTNIGGDYWEVTLEFPASATSAYKFFVNAEGNGDGNGWESGSDLQLTLGTSDTTLPLHYFRKLGSADPFAPPFEETEMMDVWFRVNVQRLIQDSNFNPATQIMMLKGGTWPGSWGDLTWNGDSAKTILAPEVGSDNPGQFTYQADYFWSGRVRIPQDSVDEGQKIEYKFVIADKDIPTSIAAWEEIDNRSFNVPQGYADTTLLWNFWMNQPPLLGPAGEDTVKVKFVTDLTRAISENGFTPGDTIIVRVGRNASADQVDHIMTRTNPLLFIYEATAVVTRVVAGEFLQYQYYHQVAGLPDRENFYDFENTGLSQADQETRKIFIPSPAPDTTQVISVYDTVAASVTSGNRQPQFPNSQLLPNDALVYWECDLRPPYYHLKFGGDSILDEQGDENYAAGEHEQILQDGVWINGPATTDWTTWGADLRNTPEKKMWDDGSNGGDMMANDTVYTTSWYYSGPDSSDRIGVVYKFGINGGDNEPGQGGFGLNHLINISTNAQKEIDTVTIHTAFGSVNPNFYAIWDFDADTINWELTDIGDFTQIIRKISLEQNYPNPFNPTTAIKFELPKVQDVKLIIYNSLGQEVAILLNGRQRQGTHLVYWNGLNKQGQPVASGIYFYKLATENFTQVRKMMLIR
jgi:hypothetical protein